jgi:MFS family permease
VGWQVYAISHDPLALGFVGLAQFLPMLALILPAGDLADRYNRRTIMTVSCLLEAAVAIGFLLLTLLHIETLWLFYLVLAVFGVVRTLSAPASQSLVPLLVPPEHLSRAIAWSSSTFQAATIAGPALGGLLYILGPAACYAVCFVLAIVVAILFGMIRLTPVPHSLAGGSAFQRAIAGIAYVRARPIILGAISLDLFAVLLGGATALLPVYAADILHVGPVGLGVLRAAFAAGAVVTGLWLGYRPLDVRLRRLVRRGDRGVRPVTELHAVAGRAARARCLRHGQRLRALDLDPGGDAQRNARPGQRRQHALRRRL